MRKGRDHRFFASLRMTRGRSASGESVSLPKKIYAECDGLKVGTAETQRGRQFEWLIVAVRLIARVAAGSPGSAGLRPAGFHILWKRTFLLFPDCSPDGHAEGEMRHRRMR